MNNTKHSGKSATPDSDIFKLLVDGVRDYAIYKLDVNGYVESWNSGAERAKQYQEHEILGQHFSLFYTPEDRAINKPQTILNLALKQGRIEDEGWRVRKDGSRFWADVIVTALFDSNGTHLGYAKVTRDMTEKRNLTHAREEALPVPQREIGFFSKYES